MDEDDPTGSRVPPSADRESDPRSPRKAILLLVGALVAASLGGGIFLVFGGGPPESPPSPRRTLQDVVISGGGSVDQAALLPLSAAAFDSAGEEQTANATWAWSAEPASAVEIRASGVPSSVNVLGIRPGTVTVRANATWNNSTLERSIVLEVNPLSFLVTSSDVAPLVGDPFTIFLRVIRADSTPATSYSGTVQFASDDPGAVLPPDYTFSIADSGSKAFPNVVVASPAVVQITVRDAVAAIQGGVSVRGNRAPLADFTLAPDAGDPLRVTVDASLSSDADGDALLYSWDFGDGGTGSGRTAEHSYATAGVYEIRLRVTDSFSASSTASQNYTARAAPTARFSVIDMSPSGSNTSVVVDASESFDPDGRIVTYHWSWGDGSSTEGSSPLTSHEYGPAWLDQNVTILLRVTDNQNLSGFASQTVRVTPVELAPVASFVIESPIDQLNRTVRVDGSGSSDPNGNLATYHWSWGDGSYTNGTSPLASHAYAVDGTYAINLTVMDTTGLMGWEEQSVAIRQPDLPPNAAFVLVRSLMRVDVDARGSSDPNGNGTIVGYAWDWGDGSGTTGPSPDPFAVHAYSVAGKYTVLLTVIDVTGQTGTARKTVSVGPSTIDYEFYDFFAVPFGEWWDYRSATYGDLPINAECFNATSISDGICSAAWADVRDAEDRPPYVNWYPLPGQIRPGAPGNNPLVYAPYRFRVTGSNVLGYNRSEPVFLPTLAYGESPGGRLDFRWEMQYLDKAMGAALTASGCPGVDPRFNDGYEIRSRIWLTLDLQQSRRTFGVVASDANSSRAWWAANTDNACGTMGALEAAVEAWFVQMGGSQTTVGKYDIVNGYEYWYVPFYTNITATVDGDGTTHVYLEHAAWGTEVLLARMFYWGNASYAANYLDSTKARGWWGMELGWLEDVRFQGSLGATAFSFTLSAVMQYHYQLLAHPNLGGFDRLDDVPFWRWGPILNDYTNDWSQRHTASELDRYPNPPHAYVHTTPGSVRYGENLSYDYVPVRWDLRAGETWHFEFPRSGTAVVFFDPNNTTLGSDPRYGGYREVAGQPTLALFRTQPGNYGTWEASALTWDVYGPAATGGPAGSPGQYPYEPWGAVDLMPSTATLVLGAMAAVAPAEGPGSAPSSPPRDGPLEPFDGTPAEEVPIDGPSVTWLAPSAFLASSAWHGLRLALGTRARGRPPPEGRARRIRRGAADPVHSDCHRAMPV